MKFLVALCLFGLACAAPQRNLERSDQDHYRTLRYEVSPVIGPQFSYAFETENGIIENREGSEGSQGQSNFVGSFSFPLDDGSIATFNYVADENGYNVESPLIPTPHPMPAHALEQIRIAEDLRAQGVEWDQQGFRI